jgi:hypothetical protein
MALGDIHKKLYSENEDPSKRTLAEDVFNPQHSLEMEKKQDDSQADFDEDDDSFKIDQKLVIKELEQKEPDGQKKIFEKRKLIKIGAVIVGVIVVFLLIFLLLIKRQESAFTEEKLQVTVTGPTEVKSGQEIEYMVTVDNQNRIDLNDAVLLLSYSEDLKLADDPLVLKEGFTNSKIVVGTVASGAHKEFPIKATTFGASEKQIYLNAVLRYQPENFQSVFEKKSQLGGIIKTSALTISMLPMREASSGEQVQLEILLKNEGEEKFEQVQLKMEYPAGFSFLNADPQPEKNTQLWDFAVIGPGEQQKVVLKGSLEGVEGAVKNFKAIVGSNRGTGDLLVYNQAEAVTKVIAQRIQLEQTINGKKEVFANAKDVLEYRIKFRNNSNLPIRNLILRENIASPVLDKSKVLAEKGYYDSTADQIVWKASDVEALKVLNPGEGGEVTFQAYVLEKFPMQNDKDVNFVISSQAQIESMEIDSPLGQNKTIYSQKIDTKVNSKLILNVSGNYNDGELPNTGPIPLKVGQETTFTLRFNLLNTSNDLKNVVLTSGFPSGIKWKNMMFPQESGFAVNEQTNSVNWMIGNLPAGTGFINPVKVVAFQVGVVPSSSQVSQNIILLNPVKITALDAFTNQPVEFNFNQFGVSDLTDIKGGDAIVIQ